MILKAIGKITALKTCWTVRKLSLMFCKDAGLNIPFSLGSIKCFSRISEISIWKSYLKWGNWKLLTIPFNRKNQFLFFKQFQSGLQRIVKRRKDLTTLICALSWGCSAHNWKVFWFQLNFACLYLGRVPYLILRKKCPCSKLFWSVFSRFRTK